MCFLPKLGPVKSGPFFICGACDPTEIDCALKHLEFSFVNIPLVLELSFKQVLIVEL